MTNKGSMHQEQGTINAILLTLSGVVMCEQEAIGFVGHMTRLYLGE